MNADMVKDESISSSMRLDPRLQQARKGAVPGGIKVDKAAVGQGPAPSASELDAPERMVKERLSEALKTLMQAVEHLANRLNFTTDEDTGRLVIKVIDRDTKQVIRQIPPEELLSLAKRLEELRGILISMRI